MPWRSSVIIGELLVLAYESLNSFHWKVLYSQISKEYMWIRLIGVLE
jgi:hypothetical protein